MNGTTQTAILVAIGIVTLTGVGGVVLAQSNATQIIGFCTMIDVSLLGLLQQTKAAARVSDVKQTLDYTTIAQAFKLEQVAAKVEEVHKATNSLTDRLIETTRIEAHAAGVKEGEGRPK